MLFSEYLFRCFSAYEKIVELYKWYNLKTRLFKKYISTTNLKEELFEGEGGCEGEGEARVRVFS
jgi:hypothetical protein